MPLDSERYAALAAAARIEDELEKAKKNNHYRDAWYAYIRRTDVETLIRYVTRKKED